MNKKRLLVVLLIVLSLGIFMSCEESMSVSLKGTWRNVETEEGVTTTTIMVFEDSSFTMDITEEVSGISVVAKGSGTYTKTDSTLTMTITSITIGGATFTGADLIEFASSAEINLTETVDYRITKSGSTVTLTVDDTSYIKQKN
jgi:hypothetical protein